MCRLRSRGRSRIPLVPQVCSQQLVYAAYRKSLAIFADPLNTALRLEELRLRNHLVNGIVSVPLLFLWPTSAIAVNTLGAERSPKESTASTYSPSSQTMPNSMRSSGCTGTILYTFLMSIFASFNLCQDSTMALAASSILT